MFVSDFTISSVVVVGVVQNKATINIIDVAIESLERRFLWRCAYRSRTPQAEPQKQNLTGEHRM